MVARFVLLCMGVDVIATLCHSWWGLRLPVNIVQIVVGLGCFAVFAWTILDHAAMPVPHARTPRPRPPASATRPRRHGRWHGR